MPPKRKAAAATKAGGKKIKEEPDAPEDAFKSAREALKSAPKKKCKSKVDENCHLSWDSTSENELNDSEDEDGLISCPQIKTATLSLLMKIQKLEAELKYERRCRIIAEKELRQCKEMNNLMAQMRGTANELRSILNYAKMGIEDAQNRNGSSAVGINQVSVASPENDSQDDKFIELPGGLKVQKNLYNRISTTDFKKYTSELLMLVFNRETLATHSLQGRKSYNSKEDFQKPPLPSEELANIIEHIKIKFGVDSSLIRAAIRTKLNNEDKMLKKRLNNLIYNDCDCMLNQTNIGHNNNKFYVIQVIKKGNQYYCWNRWGRVGEVGQSKLSCAYSSPDKALSEFEKKFKDKTKNDWKKKDNFVCHPGKYALIEVDGESEAEVKVDTVDGLKKVLPSKLDTPTKELIELIFSTDMFKEAMEVMNLDIKKMPLGKLSKVQIAKGFEVLEEMEEALKKKNKKALLEQLSSKFYTTIPHNFGRNRPPVIADMSTIEKKKEMLLVLADIELAQSLKAETEKTKEDMIEEIPHPTDQDYLSLKCELTLMDKSSKEYEIIENYLNATAGNWRRPTILNVWVVNRDKEAERYEEHDALENRRLLWHGTNIAVVAAILKSGLRIMPHSGGRVGKGIYFASENGKSAGYVGTTSKSIGIMLLNEVSLGKEYTITKDDCSLKKPPEGYDSVVARGNTEPDPSMDTFITLDGKKVTVPQGKPISQSLFSDSYFSQSEYLIYKESQCRIRYLLELKF